MDKKAKFLFGKYNLNINLAFFDIIKEKAKGRNMINEKQRIIIEKAQTPAAVIAGPGTGKTFTIVEKTIDLIKNHHIDPNKILITTFTKKAANELITRIQSKLKEEDIRLNTSNMLIGNFHSLALNFLKKYKTFDKEVFSSTVIDSFTEGYLIEKNLSKYKEIEGFGDYVTFNPVGKINEIFSDITNNLIDLETLKNSANPKDRFAYELYKTHENFLKENHLINYQMILKNFYDLLKDPVYGREIRQSIDYVIIDEYQDTNYIQQEIGFLLVREKNILVFGDDDQSLYSFRGADPSNLLNFDKICKEKLNTEASFYYLDINYRSNQNILNLANKWISREDIWDKTTDKPLIAFEKNENSNTIVRARSENFANLEKIIRILNEDINLNQIAFLFPSLNSEYPKALQAFLEEQGLEVLNKNSGRFFYRKEIKLLMYLLLNVFSIKPKDKNGSARDKYVRRQQTEFKTYIIEVFEEKAFKADQDIRDFIEKMKKEKVNNISYSDLIYRSFKLPAFQKILSQKLDSLEGIRSQTNIGSFTKLLANYENLYIDDEINYDRQSVDFFYSYIFYLFKFKAIKELEDFDTPKDAINFMTIHQAKGLEFEVVFVSGLNDSPRGDRKKFLDSYKRYHVDFQSKLRDFYRKYFTAFTRARNLCVLLDNSRDNRLIAFQKGLESSSDLGTINFLKKEPSQEKQILAFTTDISVYESCPLKYKFLRKVKMTSPFTKSLVFGSRVHELCEYVSFLRKTGGSLDSLNEFVRENPSYNKPLENFLSRDFVVETSEANYKTDRDFYILQGNIDLVLEDGSIVDIKTGKKNDELLEKYRKQIITYYNLMKLNYRDVAHIYLYFIEEDKLLEFEKDEFDIEKIDEISRNIIKENIYQKTDEIEECKFCPMKYFCKRD